MKQYDYIICGQGLAGSLLAFQLLKRNKTVLVIDNGSEQTSSHIAAGMFTPVSGKRMVKSWMADELYPEMIRTYRELESLLGTSFLNEKNIQLSFSSVKEQNDFYSSLNDKIKAYVIEDIEVNPGLQTPFGAVEINKSGWLNTHHFLQCFKQYLAGKDSCFQCEFDYTLLSEQSGKWQYNGLFECEAVIFCQGYRNRSNPWFGNIDIIENKGDVFMTETLLLDDKKIYKRGAYAVQADNNLFKAGSTYKWNDFNENPTEHGYDELKIKTDALFNGEYKIVKHLAGIRPTTKDRRPVLGEHPSEKGLYIFNGLGTKGVMLAPYFSNIMAQIILDGIVADKEIAADRKSIIKTKATTKP